MKLRKMIKQKARAALGGNRGSAAMLLLICIIVSLIINMADAAALRLLGYEFTLESPNVYTYSNDFFYNLPAIIVSVVAWLVRLVLVVPLGYGILNWHLELTDRRRESVMHIFWPYESRAALRGILLSLNIFVKLVLAACLLLAVPLAVLFAGDMPNLGSALSLTLVYSGLALTAAALVLLWAFSQRFALAPILLCEKYRLTVHQAIKASVRFTKGRRFELLRFELSFLPWVLPLLASGGMMGFSLIYDDYSVMPLVWTFVFFAVAIATYFMLTPYYTMASVMYARYLYEYGQWQQNGAQPAAEQEQAAEAPAEQSAVRSEAEWQETPSDTAGTEQSAAPPYSPQEQQAEAEVSADDGQPPSNYL